MRTVLSFLALCLAPAALHAQAGAHTDILTGRVTDLTGKPVADAQVGATSLGSGLTRSFTTDTEGRYRIFFPETARQYVVQVKRMGFAPVTCPTSPGLVTPSKAPFFASSRAVTRPIPVFAPVMTMG